jgi:hypothetical protein
MKAITFLLLLGISIISQNLCKAQSGNSSNPRPFRVAVVIGDQWDDPMSYMVSKTISEGEYSGNGSNPEVSGPTDFYHLMILLKSWAIPFDVIRLDQQFLDRNMFLNVHGEPIYGTIIWDVNQSDKLLHPDYSIIQDVVENHGIGLIALSDRISQPEIQSLLGIKHIESLISKTELKVAKQHFLTEGLNATFKKDERHLGDMHRHKIEMLDGTVSVVNQGSVPQVTTRVLESGVHTVWIGHDHNFMFYYQDIRTLLRRAITWTIGYNLYKTWDNDVFMILDDPGNAQNAWLDTWHYSTLSKEDIEQYLIKPLKENNAILNINFVPGFVNDEKRQIEPTWTQKFVDAFGYSQDYISSKKGYDKGVEEGVFEVMSHGLTHMQPDLTSAPGWWGAELDQEKAEASWYREFRDVRRGKEIPAAEQFWRMKTSRQWIIDQFGVTPLAFTPGGGASSKSYANNTRRLAGQAGFGWYSWYGGYLGKDMVVVGWEFAGTSEAPRVVAAPPNGHDFGIATDPKKFVGIFDKYPNANFISINEFIGYLHTNNSGQLTYKNNPQININVEYDQHYCQHFKKNETAYKLEFADWLIDEFGKKPVIEIDGKKMDQSQTVHEIVIPKGLGIHTIEIK